MAIKIDEYGHIVRDNRSNNGSNSGLSSGNNGNGTGQNGVITRVTTPWYSKASNFWLTTLLVAAGAIVPLEMFLFSKLYYLITQNEIHTNVAIVIGIAGGIIIAILYNVRGAAGNYIPRNYVLSVMVAVAGAFFAGFAISIIWGLIIAAVLVIILLSFAL